MTNEMAFEKLREIEAVYRERDEAAKRVAALDKRIAELMGITSQSQRKTKTFSPKEFARGCGV